MLVIRPATTDDLPAINDIYNYEVLNGLASFDTRPLSMAQRKKWFAEHDATHPVLVAELDGQVAGWASLSRYSDRKAYDLLAEDSLYIAPGHRGKGAGKALLAELLQAGRKAGLHSVLARITAGNEVSVRLHQAFGFEHMGVLREAGMKFGKLLDVIFMQLIFRD